MQAHALGTSGIHHVTAVAAGPQANVDFYAGALGLRFVKNTVNFGDPSSYHLYYGDDVGRPGTILTFFAWPDASPGRAGYGMAAATAFSVPAASLDGWVARFEELGLDHDGPIERFGDRVLPLRDPDGNPIELVADVSVAGDTPGASAAVPPEMALAGIHGVTLLTEHPEPTALLLMDTFRYEALGEAPEPDGSRRFRFRAQDGALASVVDLLHPSKAPREGIMGPGATHHVAFRTENDTRQAEWSETLTSLGFEVTPVRDRLYFRSIYFREPGGVLFEIATDPPGFTRDEEASELGSSFRLPPWLEPRRDEILAALPPLEVPGT